MDWQDGAAAGARRSSWAVEQSDGSSSGSWDSTWSGGVAQNSGSEVVAALGSRGKKRMRSHLHAVLKEVPGPTKNSTASEMSWPSGRNTPLAVGCVHQM